MASDYYRAIGEVEARLALVAGAEDPAPDEGQLLALVDALSEGTLNGKQKETLQALREGIMARARQWELVDKVEVGC